MWFSDVRNADNFAKKFKGNVLEKWTCRFLKVYKRIFKAIFVFLTHENPTYLIFWFGKFVKK